MSEHTQTTTETAAIWAEVIARLTRVGGWYKASWFPEGDVTRGEVHHICFSAEQDRDDDDPGDDRDAVWYQVRSLIAGLPLQDEDIDRLGECEALRLALEDISDVEVMREAYLDELQATHQVTVNLTPHPVVIFGLDGDQEVPVCSIPTSGTVARLSETVEETVIDGVIRTTVRLGEPTGLPEPTAGTTYVVSMPLLMGLLAAGIDRPDLRYPYGQVRDADGRIVGCRTLAGLRRQHPEPETAPNCQVCGGTLYDPWGYPCGSGAHRA